MMMRLRQRIYLHAPVRELLRVLRSQPICTRGEVDIITDFGSVVGGSSPSGCT